MPPRRFAMHAGEHRDPGGVVRMDSRQNRVVIVQPRIPAYRAAMFDHLTSLLRLDGLALVLATPALQDDDRQRCDEAAGQFAVVDLPSRSWSLGGRELTYRQTLALVSSARLAVLEQTGSNLDLYANLLRSAAWGKPLVALWGHGYPATIDRGRLEERIVGVALRLSDHFFAYTDGGSSYAVNRGVPPNRVTVLRNSLDIRSLAWEVESVVSSRSGRSIGPGNTALFIGALDVSKRLDFLIAACDKVRERIPDFSLIIGGEGPLRPWLREQCVSRPWIEHVGYLDAKSKAEWAARSAFIAMPGRVGLIAVDSFVLGKPIVTTKWRYHSVEVEYLTNGADCLVTPDEVDAYARGMCDLLSDRAELRRLSNGASSKAEAFGAEGMAKRFTEGIQVALAQGKRSLRAIR